MQGLEALREKIAELEHTFSGHIRDIDIEKLESLDNNIHNQLKSSGEIAQFSSAVRRLPIRMTNAASYDKALSQIIKDFPDDTRTNDLKDAQRDLELWQTLTEYQGIQKKYAAMIGARFIDYDQLSDWLDTATNFISDHPSFPQTKPLKKCIDFLSPIAARSDADIEAEDLKDHLDSRIYDNMHFVRFNDVDYFLPFDKPPRDSLGGKVIIFSFQDTDFDPSFVTRLVQPKTEMEKESPAPHCKLKSRLEKRLNTLLAGSHDKEDWERAHRKMLKDLFTESYWKENDQELEAQPILRHQLTALILKLSISGSSTMAAAMQDSLDDFERTGNDIWTANWLVNDTASQYAKAKALRDLKQFKAEAKSLIEKEKKLREEGWARRLPQYKPYGVILKDNKGDWTVLPSRATGSSLNGSLCLLDPNATTRNSFPSIGTVKHGKPDINFSDSKLFYTGRPVFLKTQLTE